MEKIDWNKHQGREVSFVHPENPADGFQDGAELMGALVEEDGTGHVQVKDKAGQLVLIPLELAALNILFHANAPSSDIDG